MGVCTPNTPSLRTTLCSGLCGGYVNDTGTVQAPIVNDVPYQASLLIAKLRAVYLDTKPGPRVVSGSKLVLTRDPSWPDPDTDLITRFQLYKG